MTNSYITDEEYIESVRKHCKESVDFFNSANRPKRETWVVNEFLLNLGVSFSQKELVHVVDDPPDVRFRQAEFEIKEILDPDRKRHAEFKASLKKATEAKTPQDLLEKYEPKDIFYTDVYNLVELATRKYSRKYPLAVRKELDLLFYVELFDVRGYIGAPLPPEDLLINLGFRSVSFVMGPISCVLMCSKNAPEFLSKEGQRVMRKVL